jgi:hypothetical protein
MEERDEPVSAEEAAAARSLAEALEGGDGSGADPDALAAARLLASLRESPSDDLAARKGALRVAEAARTAARRRKARRFLAPLAAAVVLAAALAGRRPSGASVTEDLLVQREAAAREALEELVSDSPDANAERAHALLDQVTESRFEKLRRQRAAELAGLVGSTSEAAGGTGGKT